MTFDAIQDLTIAGTVLEVDSIGTTSQGVVTYGVTIGFDTQDARIKSGMSVSAAVITNTKDGALLVPNSAIKLSGGVNYVQVPTDKVIAQQLMANAMSSGGVALSVAPQQQEVEIGLSNDSMTEVANGLQEGDIVIIRTVSSTTTTTTQNNSSIFNLGGRTNTGAGTTRTLQGR